MPRLIKRYGSRKLYDSTESRYVSLDEVAAFVRSGEQVAIVESKSGNDVTAAILSQILAEEGRAGTGISAGFLHDLVRAGERALQKGTDAIKKGEEVVGSAVEEARRNVDDLVGRATRTIRSGGPLGDVRSEMQRLRARLESLESSIAEMEAVEADDAARTDAPPPADA